MKNIFSSRTGIIIVGAIIGIGAALLQYLGNPGNMGICVACFERDIAGALGLHRAGIVQYLRPEIMGFVLGAFAAALFAGEYKPRGGSAPLVRFFLGMFAMIGALVFLGCPWRMLLRLAGGDGNAILGILGLVFGIFIGVQFLKRGFTLGRSYTQAKATGWIMPGFMLALFLLLVFNVQFAEGGPIFSSVEGPGSKHAPIFVSIIAGLIIGTLAQRSRFCTMGAFRDAMMTKNFHLISGVGALLLFAFLANLIFGQFNAGFEGQPIAHTNHVWNFLSMTLAGLAFALAGGCPGRQLFMSGEGDLDAGVFVIGMITGAAFAHNFSLASSPKGVAAFGPIAVIIGLVFCLVIGFTMLQKAK